MTEFCEECPMKGSMKGEIDGLLYGPYTFKAYRWSYRANESGYVGSFEDGYGGVSEVIYLPSGNLSEMAIESRIEECIQPTETFEKRGLLRKSYRVLGCPAVGALAVVDPQLRNPAMSSLRRTALAQARLRPNEA